ncbi:MAG TPA: serine/threonine protein kinase [Phycisphaerales bacterium]|nr:serine/threonine protein kinase [Phycisphaerales bacterium]
MNSILLADRYQVEKLIGRGGMCEVFLAFDTKLSKHWAVKRQKPSGESTAEESIRDEASLLAPLSHPGLPQVIDFFEEEGYEHLVLEFCPGRTLAEVLAEGAMEAALALSVAEQLGSVLQYLHGLEVPIVYRDLKPGNIILSPSHRLKLIDFGIARARTENSYFDTQALGTPGYAAPEQYGKGKSDQRTDIFGLGATLHHCLSGVHPAENPFSFPPLSQFRPGLPMALERLLDRSVALQPEDRFQSVTEFLEALDRVKNHRDMRGVMAPSPTSLESVGTDEQHLDLRIKIEEQNLKLRDLQAALTENQETIEELEAALSLEKEKARSLLARRSVEEQGASLELERLKVALELKTQEVEAEKQERRELEKSLSESRGTARSLEVNLLRYEEAFRKAGEQSRSLIGERDEQIKLLYEECRQAHERLEVAQARIGELEAYIQDLSASDSKLTLSERKARELREQTDALQAQVHQTQRQYHSTQAQLEALRLEALAIIEAQKRGETPVVSEGLRNNKEKGIEVASLQNAVGQLERALEESCRLWLRAEARLDSRET